MKFGAFGLVGLLFLTGCGSSTSLENQASLIEYEACLQKKENLSQEALKTILNFPYDTNEEELSLIFNQGTPDSKTGLIASLESAIEDCKPYHP
jgi:hypothetical protein